MQILPFQSKRASYCYSTCRTCSMCYIIVWPYKHTITSGFQINLTWLFKQFRNLQEMITTINTKKTSKPGLCNNQVPGQNFYLSISQRTCIAGWLRRGNSIVEVSCSSSSRQSTGLTDGCGENIAKRSFCDFSMKSTISAQQVRPIDLISFSTQFIENTCFASNEHSKQHFGTLLKEKDAVQEGPSM